MARTEDDTWDPASGVGMTATFGALARAVADNKGLLNDPFAEPLVRAAGVEYFSRLLDEERYGTEPADDRVRNGLIEVLAVHTRFTDEFLTGAVAAGISQVVILASGLDTRPYRLWWPPGTTLYEVDQPDVLDFKAAVLRGLGAKLRASRRSVGMDLRQDWLAALRRVGFDSDQPTAWVAEGLLVGYLPPDEQNRLLRDVTAVSAAGSRFAADHISTWTPSHIAGGQALVDGWREQGLDVELATLTYSGEYRDVPAVLAEQGWQTVERTVAEVFNATGLPGRWRGNAEDVAVSPRFVTAGRRTGPPRAARRNATAGQALEM
jgi:methyltransferase (TIGR00027 family)